VAGRRAHWVDLVLARADVSDSSSSSIDRDEFARLLSRHSRQLFGFILTLSAHRNDADDIFQETSVELWRKIETFQRGTNFRAWAYQVAYHKVLDHRRKLGRRHLLDEEAFQALARDALLITADSTSQREEALGNCLKKLPKSDRQLIDRRYRAAQSPKQIAEQTSRSVHSIYRALTRVHEALSNCVRQTLAQEDHKEARG
jgi:RNA polymerase sigma-70 factor, ECF subfamily